MSDGGLKEDSSGICCSLSEEADEVVLHGGRGDITDGVTAVGHKKIEGIRCSRACCSLCRLR